VVSIKINKGNKCSRASRASERDGMESWWSLRRPGSSSIDPVNRQTWWRISTMAVPGPKSKAKHRDRGGAYYSVGRRVITS